MSTPNARGMNVLSAMLDQMRFAERNQARITRWKVKDKDTYQFARSILDATCSAKSPFEVVEEMKRGETQLFGVPVAVVP